MSLDVYLRAPGVSKSGTGIFIREEGSVRELSRVEWDERFPGREPVVAQDDDPATYSANITHNLTRMASEAGLYEALWRPEEIGVTIAADLIAKLQDGLKALRADPDRYKKFNPENGWGDYEGLVQFVEEYFAACQANPEATVRVSR